VSQNTSRLASGLLVKAATYSLVNAEAITDKIGSGANRARVSVTRGKRFNQMIADLRSSVPGGDLDFTTATSTIILFH